MSYHSDMYTTEPEWELSDLLRSVNDATKLLQRSATVPAEVSQLIDSFDWKLNAATPSRLKADPYLTTNLWAAAFRAEKALRHDNAEQRRRDVRIALEQFRHALRDIVENQPYSDDAPVGVVLANTAEILAAPQKTLAELFGVSVRQLQRWLAGDGTGPSAQDAARIRIVGQVVNQLRHSLTGPGVAAWFYRQHPMLGRPPIDLLDDPLSYPQVLATATEARAMTA
jgi:transcriptional regulator with XRE-family HTH domain